jgi:uncharacterized membrane protein YjfL (UPF0719 family)
MSISKELANLFYFGMCLAALWGAGMLARRFEGGQAPEERTENNLALALRRAGLYVGICLGLAGALSAPSRGFGRDVLSLLWCAPVIVALFFAAWRLNDRWILPRVNNDEAVRKGNLAVALVEAGAFVATGLVLKASFSGQGGFGTGLVFFCLGQIALIAFFKLMEMLTPCNDEREIEDGNPALGLHFAGMLAALGFVLAASLTGDFTNWGKDLLAFLFAAVKGGVALLLVSWATDRAFLRPQAMQDGSRACASPLVGVGVKLGVAALLVTLL